MLYSEFIDRTSAAINAEVYHESVEPRYYDYPGNKDEFCRDWLAKQMAIMTEILTNCQKRSRNGLSETDQILWDVTKKQFAVYAKKLVKLNEKLNYSE